MTSHTNKMKKAKDAVTSRTKMVYRSVNKLVAFCSKCDTELLGNGSEDTPFICKCGAWEFDDEKKIYVLPKHE